jgi:predicted acyltransferase
MTPTKRYIALDVFRGMTICLMIIVNTPGNLI